MVEVRYSPQTETELHLFNLIEAQEHEQVVFCSAPEVGLRAIIAIHNTTLGPALGGTRMWTYASDLDALKDVLRLSRAMTYKAAVAGLNLGGGKAVIIGNPKTDKSEALFRAYGRFIEGLAGRYITAEDVGTSVQDMEYVRMETKYVTGISRALGGSGDPSPVTALGVYMGMKACVKEVFGTDSLAGRSVAVQGLGHVGMHLCRHLAKEGARLYVTDLYEERIQELLKDVKAEVVAPEAIYDVPADIFSPCALGGVINSETIPRFRFKIIAGAANNQLADEDLHGRMLMERRILYAPDYVINAGGLINVANELEGYNRERALEQARGIYDIVRQVIELAKQERIATHEAANRLAEERLRRVGAIKHIYTGQSEFSGRPGQLRRYGR